MQVGHLGIETSTNAKYLRLMIDSNISLVSRQKSGRVLPTQALRSFVQILMSFFSKLSNISYIITQLFSMNKQ